MELKEQVVSLELAKKLKEIGVKQESLFWWDGYTNFEDEIKLEYGKPDFVAGDAMFYSAFTVAELGEMLPEEIEKDEQDYQQVVHSLEKSCKNK